MKYAHSMLPEHSMQLGSIPFSRNGPRMHSPADHGSQSRSPNWVLEFYILTQWANRFLSRPVCRLYLLDKPRHIAVIDCQTALLRNLFELVDLIINPLQFVLIPSDRLLQTLNFSLSSGFGLLTALKVRESLPMGAYFRFLVLGRSLELPLDLFTLSIAL